eukprot:8079631-Alexandrium_andersonii.AAC.1
MSWRLPVVPASAPRRGPRTPLSLALPLALSALRHAGRRSTMKELGASHAAARGTVLAALAIWAEVPRWRRSG